MNTQNKQSAKKRKWKRSVFIGWDTVLLVPPYLKRLQKHRLGLSRAEFAQLEYQLYVIGCVATKTNANYLYPATTANLSNSVYIMLQRYMPFYKLLLLCIWRYLNLTKTIVPSDIKHIFEAEWGDLDDEDEEGVKKRTKIRLNGKHEIQNCNWTAKQRKAVANTRDHYFGFSDKQYPMVFDLPLGPSNKVVIREFIVGMWKAEIEAKIMFEICAKILHVEDVLGIRTRGAINARGSRNH